MGKMRTTPEISQLETEIDALKGEIQARAELKNQAVKKLWEELANEFSILERDDYIELSNLATNMNPHAYDLIETQMSEHINKRLFQLEGSWNSYMLDEGSCDYINVLHFRFLKGGTEFDSEEVAAELVKLMNIIPEEYHSLPIISVGTRSDYFNVVITKKDDVWSIEDGISVLYSGELDAVVEKLKKFSF